MTYRKHMITYYIFIVIICFPCMALTQDAQKPIISIITSLYKGDAFIEGFLYDITQQTIFDQCELIIINANSPGNEEPIIRYYMSIYPNIIYKRLDADPGIYGTWNIAIGMARGEFITNANVDDRLAKDCYQAHLKALQANPPIDLVYSDYYITNTPNETFETTQHPLRVEAPEFSPTNMVYCLPNNHPMWRKKMHKKYGLFDASFTSAGDHEMWLRAVSKGAQFMKVHGVYGLFYNNPEGLSTDVRKATRRQQEEAAVYHRYKHIFTTQVYEPDTTNQ